MARKIEVQIVGDASSLHKALGSVTTRTRRFGSILGTSFRAASVAATGGIIALGFAAKDLIQDFSDGQKATAQTNAVIKSTGGVANVTTKHVQNLATQIQGYSGIQDDVVQSGENMLLTFKNIRNEVGKGNDIFDQSTKILADMSQALGQDMSKSAIQLGKALNDPVKGITALQRVGVTFTDGQKKTIDAMVKSGHTMDAQKVILKELRSEFGGSARAAGQTFAGQMNILRGTFENAGSAIIGKLLPYITRFAQFAVPLAVKGIDLLVKGIVKLIGYFASLGSHVGVSSGKVHSALAKVGAFFQGQIMPIVRRLRDIFKQAFQNIAAVVQQHGAAINRIVARIGALLRAIAVVAIPILKVALTKVLPVIIGAAIDILDRMTQIIEKVIKFLIRVGRTAVRIFGAMVGPIQTVIGWINSLISKVEDLIGWVNKIPDLHSILGFSGSDLLNSIGGGGGPGRTGQGGGRGPNIRQTPSVVHVHVMLDRRELGRAIIDIDKNHRRQNAGRALLSGASS